MLLASEILIEEEPLYLAEYEVYFVQVDLKSALDENTSVSLLPRSAFEILLERLELNPLLRMLSVLLFQIFCRSCGLRFRSVNTKSDRFLTFHHTFLAGTVRSPHPFVKIPLNKFA